MIEPTLLTFAAGGAGIIYKLVRDYWDNLKATERVLKAEKKAFEAAPVAFAQRTEELKASQASLEIQARELGVLISNSQAALQVGNLFDLYSKQIEQYQLQTQARAGWSFIFAIVAMGAGLGFIVWGGAHILANPGWENVAAGSGVSAIGAATGAYITKTFLDVHKLSLNQLNHYFKQPVLNAHILTAQRLADQLADKSAKQKAYDVILSSVASLIHEDVSTEYAGDTQHTTHQSTDVKRSRKRAAVDNHKSDAGLPAS
jgi:hypothetical protein